jgi:GNAT superfamily N-acetyltransferase
MDHSPMPGMYQLIERVATADEYRALCVSVGWGEIINFEAARTALPHSLYGVVVARGDHIIGMGRIVGDGAIFYYIQDVAVHPDHQRQGVGKLILRALVTWINDHAPEKAFVGLFADHGKEAFYEQFGFAEHRDALTGMFAVTPIQKI